MIANWVGLIVRLNCCVAETGPSCPPEASVTFTVKVVAPAAVGLPEIAPALLKERPAGSEDPPTQRPGERSGPAGGCKSGAISCTDSARGQCCRGDARRRRDNHGSRRCFRCIGGRRCLYGDRHVCRDGLGSVVGRARNGAARESAACGSCARRPRHAPGHACTARIVGYACAEGHCLACVDTCLCGRGDRNRDNLFAASLPLPLPLPHPHKNKTTDNIIKTDFFMTWLPRATSMRGAPEKVSDLSASPR